ncbi:MAG: transcriptional repressor [Sphaerochaetaceae bacterium]|nr:transcriptional repressor [Sphaerochaetaceae bacterium]
MTSYSKKILDIINSSREHLTAEQVYFKMKEQEPKIVLASVYNNLNRLHAEGLIRKVILENCPDRYDRLEKHDHLVCSRCGKLSDIHLSDFTAQIEKQTGVKVLSYDLKVNYLCPECRAREDNKRSK